MKEKTCIVSESMTLIDFLKGTLNEYTAKKIKSFIKYNMIEVDGKIANKATEIVKGGSTVKIYFTKRLINEFGSRFVHSSFDDRDVLSF